MPHFTRGPNLAAWCVIHRPVYALPQFASTAQSDGICCHVLCDNIFRHPKETCGEECFHKRHPLLQQAPRTTSRSRSCHVSWNYAHAPIHWFEYVWLNRATLQLTCSKACCETVAIAAYCTVAVDLAAGAGDIAAC